MRTRALPHRTNRESFSDFVRFTDDDGEPLDIGTVTEITVRIRDPYSNTVMLEATLTGETVEETGDGEVQFTFTADQMGALNPQPYEFGVLLTTQGETIQTHLSPLYIVEGL